MHPNAKTRTIHTGLYGKQAKAVIEGVYGQLSDGKYENTPGYDKYWTNFDVETADDGEVIFKVNAEGATTWCRHYMPNPFYGMSDIDFKKWIARKIKAVANDECKECSSFGEWDRRNIDHTTVYLGEYDTVLRDIVTTVADVYCTYEALLGRKIGIAKYDSSTICNVFGTKRSDEETTKAKSLREAKEDVIKKYDAIVAAHREAQKKAEEEALAKVKAQFDAKLEEIRANRKNELAALEATA